MELLRIFIQPGLVFHLENASELRSFQSPYLRPSKVSIGIHQLPLNFRYTTPFLKERLGLSVEWLQTELGTFVLLQYNTLCVNLISGLG